MLYNEYAFLDRFDAAARDGFAGVEFLFPYAFSAHDIQKRLADHALTQVLFNAPPGDWDAGERGMACIPGREAEFQAGVLRALEYAEVLACPNIHVMAGIKPSGLHEDLIHQTYCRNVHWAAEQAAKCNRNILIEPINTRDMPGYFLNYQAQAHAIVEQLGQTHLKVQMDLYHCQIMEGDLLMKIKKYLPTTRVGHFQIAGVPSRHEPDAGEIHYASIFNAIDELSLACDWQGWIGCEYRPARGVIENATRDGLGWFKPYARQATNR